MLSTSPRRGGPPREGRPGHYRRYDWKRGRRAEGRRAPRDLLVVEGVGAGTPAYADLVTVLVWVEADDADRLARGIARDGVASREQLAQWMADEAPYLVEQRTRERADLVVRT